MDNTAANHYRNKPVLPPPFPRRSVPAVQLIILSILFCTARIPFLGHILSLDEAWVLSALRSISGGQTLFTDQFWRHPPLYLLMALALDPLQAAFEYRLELLTMLISLITLLLLVRLTARYFGSRIALYTGIIFLFAPGPVFFDTWIKRDCLVTMLGILAIMLVLHKKELWAGVLLGLAFLSKETAVFYGISLFFLICFHNYRRNTGKRLLKVYGVAIITAGGWYVFLSQYYTTHLDFFLGNAPDSPLFISDWWYYFAKLQLDLGGGGLLFFIIGLTCLLWRRSAFRSRQKAYLLPLSLIVPAYLILAMSQGKPPWMTISLYPFLALVSGIGAAVAVSTFTRLAGNTPRLAFLIPVISPIIIALMLILPQLTTSYAQRLDAMCPGTLQPIRNAYIMADSLNNLTTDGETLLLFPDLYRGGSTALDPILLWQLNKDIKLIHNMMPQNLYSFKVLISRNRVNWVIIYPIKGSIQERLTKEIQESFNPVGYWVRGALLLKVDVLWKDIGQETGLDGGKR